MTNQSKYNPEYQAIIFNTILKALETHPRLTMVRCDLRFPLETTDAENDSGVITRFIASLKAKIKADLKRKGKEWYRLTQLIRTSAFKQTGGHHDYNYS